MLVQPVVNNASYPFSATFTSDGGKLLVQFSGSAWRGTAGKASVNLLMDGNVIATASVVTNEATSHKALVPVAVLISAAAGSHTLSVAPSSSATKVDASDFFTVTVTESAPNYFETGRVELGYHNRAGWPLGTPGVPVGTRTTTTWREPITFSKTFNAPPQVTVALSVLDLKGGPENIRLVVRAENITDVGFDLVCSTWDDSAVFYIDVSWLAFGDAQ